MSRPGRLARADLRGRLKTLVMLAFAASFALLTYGAYTQSTGSSDTAARVAVHVQR